MTINNSDTQKPWVLEWIEKVYERLNGTLELKSVEIAGSCAFFYKELFQAFLDAIESTSDDDDLSKIALEIYETTQRDNDFLKEHNNVNGRKETMLSFCSIDLYNPMNKQGAILRLQRQINAEEELLNDSTPNRVNEALNA